MSKSWKLVGLRSCILTWQLLGNNRTISPLNVADPCRHPAALLQSPQASTACGQTHLGQPDKSIPAAHLSPR